MGEEDRGTNAPVQPIDQSADPAPYIDPLYAG